MRVLLTTDTVGGVWVFTEELAGQLLDRGHAVALVSFGRAPLPAQAAWVQAQRTAYGERFRFEAWQAPLEWMRDNAGAYTLGAAVLTRVAKEFEPDLLHSSQFCWGSLPLPIPRLITAHSDVFSWAEACRPEGLEDSPWLRIYRTLVQRGLEEADAVTAPTRWMLGALGLHFRLPTRASVISNGRILSAPPAVERKLQAISVGRLWDPAKNIAILNEIASPMPMLIAGEQSFEQSSPQFEKTSLAWLGLLAEDALQEAFAESSLYMVTSIYEPFGLAPLEAALCGCAIVANDLPSLREVWGDAALYFHGAGELEALLHRLAANPDLLKSAATRARAQAAELTAERMADHFLDLYENLLNLRPKPHRSTLEEVVAHA